METILLDLRYCLRVLLKRPGFTMIAVITLVLGIGASTAIFSVVNVVVLNPFPYRDPTRLSLVRQRLPKLGVGKRIKLGRLDSKSPWFTVKGGVTDSAQSSLDAQVRPEAYFVLAQMAAGPVAAYDIRARLPHTPGQVHAFDRAAETRGHPRSSAIADGRACPRL